jgi:hypothetical protein
MSNASAPALFVVHVHHCKVHTQCATGVSLFQLIKSCTGMPHTCTHTHTYANDHNAMQAGTIYDFSARSVVLFLCQCCSVHGSIPVVSPPFESPPFE